MDVKYEIEVFDRGRYVPRSIKTRGFPSGVSVSWKFETTQEPGQMTCVDAKEMKTVCSILETYQYSYRVEEL